MLPSTAKREKLVGPLQLALIGVLFAVSFVYLLPKQDAFIIGEANDEKNAPAIGELDLAYLKARSASGEPSSTETTRAVVALIKTGQMDTARELLDDQPDLDLDEQERFSLDLEMASVNYYAADSEEVRASQRLELLNRIELLLNKPRIRTVTHLTRGAELAEQLGSPDTSIALYSLLAEHDSDNASQWYTKCARAYAAQKNHQDSTNCFEQAIETSKSSDEVFDLRLEQFAQIAIGGNVLKQDSALNLLSTHQPISNKQREKLAAVMLANQRPDQAYPLYERLAKDDNTNQISWLLEAARWAQASNEPAQAATYYDQVASLSAGSQKIDMLKKAESLLIAAGKNNEAYARMVKRINTDSNDESLLREGIVLARQLGKNDQAALWNEQLVRINPADADAVNAQVELALAKGDLPAAAKWARQAADLNPDSKAARLRLAQVYEWTGDPVAAQREWEWIAGNYPEAENIAQLVRLAELNRDSAVAAVNLRKLVLLDPSNEKEIVRLVYLYELEGKPLAAASLLNELQAKGGLRANLQRGLAHLYQRHVLFPESLAAWNTFANNFGRNTDETLNRMELLWRLKKPAEAAEIARHLVGTSNASEASKYQIHLISEIAWRYRIPKLAELVKPRLETIKDEHETIVLGKRLVQSLEDAGKDKEAIEQATRLWQSTQSADIAFTAMNLAYKTGQTESAAPYLVESEETAELRKKPDYWNLAASIHQKNGRRAEALAAYERALALDSDNSAALSGLLWSYIDAQDSDAIADFILAHKDTAENEPALWSPFGIGYLQLGLAEQSLTWFDRQLDRIEADYNMLLTFADALEYAGRAEPARKVRLYTIRKLRPVLAEGSTADQSVLVRQYAQLLNRYGSAQDKERLTQLLLSENADQLKTQDFWREDIAISWLMATQRHEHARMVMAKLHHKRLAAPAWQELALAMAANDINQIHHVLNGTGEVSVGNHILALRQVGQDQNAFTMAKRASLGAPSLSDREIARGQYQAMRSERPRYTSGHHKQTSMNDLGLTETGFSIRHSFDSMNLGFAVDYTNRTFSSDRYMLADSAIQDDIALTLFHGDRRFGGRVTAGFNTNQADSMAYALTRHHLRNVAGSRTVSAELAYNEASTASALLRVAAKQNRATLGYEQALGFREYVKLEANVNDISTRIQERRVARGLQARIEFGIRGAFGSNVWSTNVSANRSQNDLADSLPAELNLAPGTSIGSILTDKNTSLSFGASLSRGGTQSDYPQATSPRYFLNANVAHSWPDKSVGLQLDGGAGFRVLGGDELSIGFAHDTQPSSEVGSENDTTSIGVNYRYHF